MKISRPLKVTKIEAATRQLEAAIDAFERGELDVAITLAGAAEGTIERTGLHLFAYLRDRTLKGVDHQKEWIPFLNFERDWLKHPTLDAPDEIEIAARSAVFMMARAASKLEHWTPKIAAFSQWYKDNIDAITGDDAQPANPPMTHRIARTRP